MGITKAFFNRRANALHFTFPNGNKLSVTWAEGTYCDNYDRTDSWDAFLDSDTAEIMLLNAGEKARKSVKRLLKEKSTFGDGEPGPYARVDILELTKVMAILAK